MSDGHCDTLAGGERQGEELTARGRQMGKDLAAGREQRGADGVALGFVTDGQAQAVAAAS
jgi:hypothetical protein